MGLEIERRFLVKGDGWKKNSIKSENLEQGYLIINKKDWTVRVRVSSEEKAWITLKSPLDGIISHEFEYQIPKEDANSLLALANYRIEKIRYQLDLTHGNWIVDCFEGENAPLIIAEVELVNANLEIEKPDWCGQEITENKELSNAALAKTPISRWTTSNRAKVITC